MPATTTKLLIDRCSDSPLTANLGSPAMPTMAIPCQRPCPCQVAPSSAHSLTMARDQRTSEPIVRLATTVAQSGRQLAASSPESGSHTSSTSTRQAYSAIPTPIPFWRVFAVSRTLFLTPCRSTTHPHLRCRLLAQRDGRVGSVVLPKALKAAQEPYWLDEIARNREKYFFGRGESPGWFVGSAAADGGLEGTASPEQVRAMFQGLDSATAGSAARRCGALTRAPSPRPRRYWGAQAARPAGTEELQDLAKPKALKGDARAGSRQPTGWAAPGGSRRRLSSASAVRCSRLTCGSCTGRPSTAPGSSAARGQRAGAGFRPRGQMM
jgi:hypothetical protein